MQTRYGTNAIGCSAFPFGVGVSSSVSACFLCAFSLAQPFHGRQLMFRRKLRLMAGRLTIPRPISI
jgi:hypothetical protein